MVKERVQYVCEFCQKEFTIRGDAEDCENRCRLFAEFPGLEVLHLSPRTFNSLNWFGIYTVRDVAQLSERDYKKIKGFGPWCLKEVKAKLFEYGIEDAGGNHKETASVNHLRIKIKATRSIPQLDINRTYLNDELREKLTLFVESLDWPRQYKQYTHYGDNWESGFHNIVYLEKEITEQLALGFLTREDVVKIARWEKPNGRNRMTCPAILKFEIDEIDNFDFENILSKLTESVKGTGPLFLTTIMRFTSPSRVGSLDTNLVRLFGVGDSILSQNHWLNLFVRRNKDTWSFAGNRWSWPYEGYKWNIILGFLVSSLNERNIACPHPNEFLEQGLRENGKWTCADVEMALSSHANNILD